MFELFSNLHVMFSTIFLLTMLLCYWHFRKEAIKLKTDANYTLKCTDGQRKTSAFICAGFGFAYFLFLLVFIFTDIKTDNLSRAIAIVAAITGVCAMMHAYGFYSQVKTNK